VVAIFQLDQGFILDQICGSKLLRRTE